LQRANGFSVHGAYAEYMVADAAFVARVPDHLDPLEVAPLMCAGLTAYGGVKRARLAPGSRVAIFGCGGLGLYAVQIARRAGAEVWAVDVSEAKLEQARRCGADHALISDPGTGAAIRTAGGVDAVINFAPTPVTWPAMLAAVRPLGRIVAAALVSEPVPVSQDWLTATGVEITGTSVGTRLELRELLAMHAREPFVSELTRVRLSEANDALDNLEAGRVTGRQVIDFGFH
jgi:propanol-preferring alcohol dehydrogenase